MSAPTKVRLLSDLRVGDTVATPSGRKAYVYGFIQGRVDLRYLDTGEEVCLFAHHLTLVERGKPHAFPKGFFQNATKAAAT